MTFIRILCLWLAIQAPSWAEATVETSVQMLPLAPELTAAKAEYSGLSWCGDELFLLPQRPTEGGPVGRNLYSLPKAAILKAVKNPNSREPLPHKEIALNDKEFRSNFTHFDGYEAIVCEGENMWLAVEARVGDKYFYTALVSAHRNDAIIEVRPKPITELDSQSKIWNMSNEALVLNGKELVSIHEANSGRADSSIAIVSVDTASTRRLPFPSLPYRVTDATALDGQNRFWIVNYLWRGDPILQFNQDWIAARFSPGKTHRQSKNLERLIELQLTDKGVVLTDSAPIYLQLVEEDGRNWEGIARLDDLGFLLVTDEFPETYFGFVPIK